MTGEIAAQLIMHTLAAHARFGERKTVIEGERRTKTRVVRIEAIDDHVLTIVEVPDQDACRFEVFLSPSEEDETAPVNLVADFRLFAISVRRDGADLLLRQDLTPDAWLAPVARSLHLALAPLLAEIERQPQRGPPLMIGNPPSQPTIAPLGVIGPAAAHPLGQRPL